MNLNKKIFDIDESIDYMKNYINTYKQQSGYKSYTAVTFIDDMLYGLGMSLSNELRYRDGFDVFKKQLVQYLERFQ